MKLFAYLAILLAIGSSAARGQDTAPSQSDFGLSEVRGGLTMSSVETYGLAVREFDLANLDSVQFDAYFRIPEIDALSWIGTPRPHVGGVLNLRGRESYAHLGLNWHFPLGDVLFTEAGVGVGIHDGALNGATYPLRNLGCRTLVHWNWAVGWNLSEDVTLAANVQHMSNTFACSPNDGINNFGLQLGYKF